MEVRMIIAIDGPAASGKGTIAKKLAQKLNVLCLDTGAIYRSIAVCALRNLDYLTADIVVKCGDQKQTLVYLNGEDITSLIRTVAVGTLTPQLAIRKDVQDRVHQIQHQTAQGQSLVVEGRETTSVVFPHADFKFFVTAAVEVRAARRLADLLAKGENITYDEVLSLTKQRDRTDTERAIAPLVQMPDAVLVDTTGRNPDEVVDEMLAIILQ